MKKQTNPGFSLIEIMVAMAILMLSTYMFGQFFLYTSKTLLTTESKLVVNNDMRKLTNYLSEHTREANSCYILNSYNKSGNAVTDVIPANTSGDYLLLVEWHKLPADPGGPFYIQKIRGYFRGPDPSISNPPASAQRPVWFYEIDYGTSSANWAKTTSSTDTNAATQQILDIVKSKSSTLRYKKMANLAQGLENSRMFYDMIRGSTESIVVKIEIIEQNNNYSNPIITNTYNLTISPRG